jgi:ABC-2 type transport system ATP-binding protein
MMAGPLSIQEAGTPAVDVRRLSRTYEPRRKSPRVVALNDVSLRVEQGEVHGLLGPNGAGKTTLVRVLATLVLPTTGSAAVLGNDVASRPARVRELIGVVFGGERGLYLRASARQNLLFWAAMYRLDKTTARRRADELLDRFGLSNRADELVERYSRGMKQRVHIARGLMHQPSVLFLDEPTAGMDVAAAHEFRQVVADLKQDGATIVLTTHDMTEAEHLCDRISVIDRGKLLLTGRTNEVGSQLRATDDVEFAFERCDAVWLQTVRTLPWVATVDQQPPGDRWRVRPVDAAGLRKTLAWLVAHGVTDLRTTRPTLSEVYLHTVRNGDVVA